MTTETTSTDTTLPFDSSPQDFARYALELEGMGLTDEQQGELLSVLFSIMRAFVDLGIDVSALDIETIMSGEVIDEEA